TSFAVSFTDVAPTVVATSAAVSAPENAAATNSGSFADYDDAVALSASTGTLIQNADGTWSWLGTGDEDHPYTVIITSTNADTSTSSTSFAVSFTDVAPTVAAANASVTSNEGQSASNTGTFADYDDVVSLSVNEGSISKMGSISGVWT